ncbi:MAG: hypothetical protein MZV70_06900 [Desulfobacterales bacterium]|nr:hypothetical protein [Desulfobacterales bacterium]
MNENCTCCGKCAEACQTEIAERLRLRDEEGEGRLPALHDGLPGALRDRPHDRQDRGRPARQGGLPVRRGRPRDGSPRRSPSTSGRWSGRPGWTPTTPRRWTTSASASTRTSSPT